MIDTSGYLPRCVGGSAQLLDGRVSHYLFVSSLSVYADNSVPGQDENARIDALADPASEDIAAHYGPLKAACEQQVLAAFAERATIVRPGLIVGPHDPTDRFSYWVARFLHPRVLGERGVDAVVPAPPSRPVQFIDARDLAEWMLDLAAARVAGTFNACSPPGRWTFGALVDALMRHERADSTASRARVDRRREAPRARRRALDRAAAVAAGSRTRRPRDSCRSRAAGRWATGCASARSNGRLPTPPTWLARRDNALAWRNVLSAAKEDALLQAA